MNELIRGEEGFLSTFNPLLPLYCAPIEENLASLVSHWMKYVCHLCSQKKYQITFFQNENSKTPKREKSLVDQAQKLKNCLLFRVFPFFVLYFLVFSLMKHLVISKIYQNFMNHF